MQAPFDFMGSADVSIDGFIRQPDGTFHMTSASGTSWAGFAKAIF
jgi:hypothetical protein